MRRPAHPGVYLMLALLVVTWGIAYPIIKLLLGALTPVEIMLARFWLTGLALLGVAVANRRAVLGLLRRHPARIVLLALLGVPGYHLTLNYGTRLMMDDPATADCAATVASILVASLPAWTALFARLAGQETMSRLQWLGQGIAFAGVVVVVSRGDLTGLNFTPGALLTLCAPLSWALYSVVARPLLSSDRSSLPLVALAVLLGTLLMTPLTPPTLLAHLGSLSASLRFWLLFLGLAATFIGYVVWAFAIARLGANRTSVSIYFIPLSTLIAGALMLGERVGAPEILGGLVILAGVVLTGRRGRP